MAQTSEAPIGVVLSNLGGPVTLDDVEPFLTNLFSDRDIIPLPFGAAMQPLFARLIAKLRGPAVRRRYAGMGGGSPQLAITRAQAAALETALNRDGRRFRTFVAMRYWHPFAEETFAEMEAAGIRRVVVVTMYPQYSTATTGSMDREIERILARPRWQGRFELTGIRSYPDDPTYLEAMADTVRRGLEAYPADRRDQVVLLFSAHALPSKIVEGGDPYVREIEATRQGILAKLGLPNRQVLSYQSRSGPVRWIGPGTEDVIKELGREGVKDLFGIPISFVGDHIETLYELDDLYAEEAHRAGITGFRRAEALNTNPIFIEALAGLVRRHLETPS